MKKQDSQAQVSQMFNTISSSYDKVNRILSFGIDLHWRKKMCKYLPKKNNLRVLDLATGTCDQLMSLLKSNQISYAMGLDLAEEMLEIGRKKIAASPYTPKIELKIGSALEIPAPSASFNCVTMSFGIRNVQGNCLSEIFRVLAPKGKALILEFSLPKNKVIRGLHLFYLRKVLPQIGGWISGERKAYSYLNQTIETFPYGGAFLALMAEAGFVGLQAIPLTFGVATLYIGEKQ